jgi:hypothetical protein
MERGCELEEEEEEGNGRLKGKQVVYKEEEEIVRDGGLETAGCAWAWEEAKRRRAMMVMSSSWIVPACFASHGRGG